jgi:hypothetical protein
MTVHENNLALALRYAAAGLRVFPVNENKQPLVAHWPLDATTDPEKIRNWWRRHPNAGVGLPAGEFVVVDADKREEINGVSELAKLFQRNGQPPGHPIVDTPSGGEHHIFRNPARLGNSIGGLKGLGIDIRGCGGYIVAPGTVLPRGRWAHRDGTPCLIQSIKDGSLPDAPDCIVDRIRQTDRDRPKQATILHPIGPGSADNNHINAIIRNALDRVASSVEGTRNETLNQAAFTIGGLLHTGVLDIGQAWHQLYDAAIACGLGEGADGDRSIRATIESGLGAGQGQPFTPSEHGEDRPLMSAEESAAQTQARGLALKWHGEPQEPIRWLAKGLFPSRGVGLIAGQSGVGKSFVAVELAGALATGMPFFDRRIPAPGGTLFVLGEAEGTMAERLEALCQGKLRAWQGENLPIAWAAIENLAAAEADIVATCREASKIMQQDFGVPLRLVIVDTIAATFALQDENDSAEATRAMKTLQRIAEQTGTLVIGVAHYGKNVEVGVRGSSAFTASADVILAATWKRTMTGQVTQRSLSLDKSRRAETGWCAEFFLYKTKIGHDEDGDEITSCFVISSPRATPVAANDNPKPKGRPLSKAASFYCEAMKIALDASGQDFRPDGTDLVRAVERSKILTEFTSRYPADGDTVAKRRENTRKQFKRGEDTLIEKKIIACRERDSEYLLWSTSDSAEDGEATAEAEG